MKLFLLCSDDAKAFYQTNKKLLSYPNYKEEINSLTSVKKLSNSQIELLIKHGWIINHKDDINLAFPVLNQANSEAINRHVESWAQEVADKLISSINSLHSELGNDYEDYVHTIVAHIILGYLWQQVLHRILKPKKHGTIVLVRDKANVCGLFSHLTTINNDLLWIYADTLLQQNNNQMCLSFDNNNMVKLLRSINEQGYVLPYAQQEEVLMALGVAKRTKIKGSVVDYFKLTVPSINKDMVMKLRPILKQFTAIGYKELNKLIAVLNTFPVERYPDLAYANKEDFLQAAYFIAKHALVNSLINKEILPAFTKVPDLVELVVRLRGDIAIDA